jgi:hypothetical protein
MIARCARIRFDACGERVRARRRHGGRHRDNRLPHRLQFLRHRRQAHVRVVGLLAKNADAFRDIVDEQLLVGERLAVRPGLVVDLRRHGLEGVGQPADHLVKLLLLLLQHPDLRHQQLMRLVGCRRRRRRQQHRNRRRPQPCHSLHRRSPERQSV